ncbi:hypothetical protein HaLaN_23825, partial [Haematococcus lacustris]
QEVLDVVLALHDIRTAQISKHLPSTHAHLPLPVSSGAFARRLSQRQRSASSNQLNLFVEALERDTIVEHAPRHADDVYVQRLEAACQLLHRKLQPASIAAAQPSSSCSPSHNAPSAALPISSAAGNTAAVELCTLLLTDQEVLDVVLALHDIRTVQLCNLLSFTRARLPSPVSSGAFARRLSQRQHSASGKQLHLFVEALGRDTIV